MGTYRISQLAERAGVPASTLRYYESAGLLPAQRSPGGYRLYDETAVARLGFITTAKRLGLALVDIAELLYIWDTGACAEVKSDLHPRLRARLTEARQRHEQLSGLISILDAAIAHLDSLPDRAGQCDQSCALPTFDVSRTTAPEAPVACALASGDVGDRIERWRDILADAARMSIPSGLQLTVPIDRLATISELAAAEQECCPFFDFWLHLDGPDLHVQVCTTAAGQGMLEALFDPASCDSGPARVE